MCVMLSCKSKKYSQKKSPLRLYYSTMYDCDTHLNNSATEATVHVYDMISSVPNLLFLSVVMTIIGVFVFPVVASLLKNAFAYICTMSLIACGRIVPSTGQTKVIVKPCCQRDEDRLPEVDPNCGDLCGE